MYVTAQDKLTNIKHKQNYIFQNHKTVNNPTQSSKKCIYPFHGKRKKKQSI